MNIAPDQESFRVRATRRISKALSRTSGKSTRVIRKTSAFAEQQIRRTSKFATEVDSGLNKMGIYDIVFRRGGVVVNFSRKKKKYPLPL